MGGIELMPEKNGDIKILCIDKGGQKVNVGTKLSDFNIIRNLGKGHFGSVKLVSSKLTNKLYAMKEIICSRYKTEAQRKQVEKEIKLLENLYHPHVITYFNSFREKGNIYIIIEYINGGSLEDLLISNIKKGKRIDEKSVWDLLVQSLSGLLYLHETKKIIHRDIKPDNLLLDSEGHLKISDFGVSAIQGEDIEELLKCHGTIRGPIQFMSPEMALGDKYDFKSDLYMLGLTFFFMLSNKLPEKKLTLGPLIIPIPNPNAKIPDVYSQNLKNFILSLLKDPVKRPTTKEAYDKAISYYTLTYLKTTSICSTLLCLFSVPEINKYFQGESVAKKIQSDALNKTEKYIITEAFKETLLSVNPSSFDNKKARLACLKLRLFLYLDKERVAQSSEIELNNFAEKLLLELHKELNKYQGDNNNEKTESKTIDETNAKNVVREKMKKFVKEYLSKISEQFYYISKVTEQCSVCNNVIRYLAGINSLCGMYPDKTAKYLKKKDISIIDMFRNYNKVRLYTEVAEECKFCKKKIDKIFRTKIFYTCPLNFILEICYSDEDFNLIIDEHLNLQDFVERKDYSKYNYYLVGAIFIEEEKNKEIRYVSISRRNNGWFYYDGNTLKSCTFKDLANLKHLKMLFYSTNDQ